MSVHQVAVEYNDGASAEEILRRYPHLDLARIHAGFAYYLANAKRIDAELREKDEQYQEELERQRVERTGRASAS